MAYRLATFDLVLPARSKAGSRKNEGIQFNVAKIRLLVILYNPIVALIIKVYYARNLRLFVAFKVTTTRA
jgi:hypothetical protein